MQVIPVLDLMGGVVVRARMGDRVAYRPIQSPLSRTSDPVDVVNGFMDLAAFENLYIADLDAIQRRGDNNSMLVRLRETFPKVVFWIDNGAADIAAVKAARRFGQPVLGSESQHDLALTASQRNTLLSLDYRGEQFLGPQEILDNPDDWPERVIVMTLASVGVGAGPDLERIASVQAIAGSRKIYAAGGLRDAGDLGALKEAGVAGVLVASALHGGKLGPNDLR